MGPIRAVHKETILKYTFEQVRIYHDNVPISLRRTGEIDVARYLCSTSPHDFAGRLDCRPVGIPEFHLRAVLKI